MILFFLCRAWNFDSLLDQQHACCWPELVTYAGHQQTHYWLCKVDLLSSMQVNFNTRHLFSCDQAALRTLISVRLSVRHTFLTMFLSWYYPEIFRSCYHWPAWCPCKRSRSKVKVTQDKKSPILTQIERFRTVTPLWIHRWLWNDALSLK